MLGKLGDGRLQLSEIHRFASRPVRVPDGLHTDVLHIWSELKTGVAKATLTTGGALDGIGVDTWGVDFALLDNQAALLANPYHYRDALTEGILPKAFERVARAELFERINLRIQRRPYRRPTQVLGTGRQSLYRRFRGAVALCGGPWVLDGRY
jgi:rhamnulokinase